MGSAMRSRRWVATGALGAAATAMLGGCGVQLPGAGAPPRIFTLTPKSTFEPDMPSVDWQLLVDLPAAPAGLNSPRIAVRRGAIELDYVAQAAWTDTAPQMIQTLLIESFENSGRIVAVGRQTAGLRADFILRTDLREFQAEYPADGSGAGGVVPSIHVRLNAKLVRMPDRAIVASNTVAYNEPAAGSDLTSMILGYDAVLGKILRRIVSWTLREGARHHMERPASALQQRSRTGS